jgi:hypothetical protein
MFPLELLYVLIAGVVGWLLYRYFSGHGGMGVERDVYAGLPAQGRISAKGRDIGWTAADDDSFAAAWPTPSGHWIAIRAAFEPPPDDGDVPDDDENADLALLDITVAERSIVKNIRWTDKILDRSLRGDVEAVLKVLARIAKDKRSGKYALAGAKPVGTRQEIE